MQVEYTTQHISGYWWLSSLLLKLFYHERNEEMALGLDGFVYVHPWEQSHQQYESQRGELH